MNAPVNQWPMLVCAFLAAWVACGAGRAEAAPEPAFDVSAFDGLATFREGETPAGGAGSVRVSAGLGETEGFQVVVRSRSDQALTGIRVAVTGLEGIRATVYAAGSVLVEKPGRTTDAVPGRYFDLLRPAGWESIGAGTYRPYWVDLAVPAEGLAPGTHRGQVVVTAGGQTRSLPITVQVRAFRLPVVPSLKLAFAFVPSWMETYYGRKLTPVEVRAAQEVMLDHRLGPVAMWSSGPELFEKETLRHCLDRGMNVVIVTCGGTTDEAIEKSLAALEPKVALLKELGALDRTYLFGYDEITMFRPEAIPAMRKAYETFHARHPEIKRVNTSAPDDRLKEFVDIYVVPTSRYELRMGEGREAWWYSVGADNLKTEPDFRMDFPPAVQRGFFLADRRVGVKGHLYWAVTREWPGNKDLAGKPRPEEEWRAGYENVNSKKWSQDNGGGNLFYPDGAGSMLPSVRAKRVRDGIEDYEYVAQLEGAVAELERARPTGWQALRDAARALLSVPENVVKAGGGIEEGWSFAGPSSARNLTTHPSAIRGGKQALRVLPELKEMSAYQDAPAAPGESLAVSGWIKTDDLTGTARLRLEARDAKGAVLLARESQPVTGSSRKFVEVSAEIPAAPAGTATLRIHLSAVAATPSTDPLQKAFFDDILLRRAGKEQPLANPGFESERLWVNPDPGPLLAYRERVGECLDRCARALGKPGPFER